MKKSKDAAQEQPKKGKHIDSVNVAVMFADNYDPASELNDVCVSGLIHPGWI